MLFLTRDLTNWIINFSKNNQYIYVQNERFGKLVIQYVHAAKFE